MNNEDYKKYTQKAKTGIKGEAFFESLIADYAIPNQIVGSKDLGLDFICEWTFGDKPTGILFGIQIKTFSEDTITKPKKSEDTENNKLEKFKVNHTNLTIGKNTLNYWKGFGIPIFLFAIVEEKSSFNCFYQRFTSIITKGDHQDNERFFKVNKKQSFIAFKDFEKRTGGFARDLFIDHMRFNYFKGSISYLNPRDMGLNEFPKKEGVFVELFNDYSDSILTTYSFTKSFIDKLQIKTIKHSKSNTGDAQKRCT